LIAVVDWLSGRAFAGQRDHRGRHARDRTHGRFGRLAHRLPLWNDCRIHGDREEHLPVADDHVGQLAGLRQWRTVGTFHRGQRREHVFLGGHTFPLPFTPR
jgi:hypothetical protein